MSSFILSLVQWPLNGARENEHAPFANYPAIHRRQPAATRAENKRDASQRFQQREAHFKGLLGAGGWWLVAPSASMPNVNQYLNGNSLSLLSRLVERAGCNKNTKSRTLLDGLCVPDACLP